MFDSSKLPITLLVGDVGEMPTELEPGLYYAIRHLPDPVEERSAEVVGFVHEVLNNRLPYRVPAGMSYAIPVEYKTWARSTYSDVERGSLYIRGINPIRFMYSIVGYSMLLWGQNFITLDKKVEPMISVSNMIINPNLHSLMGYQK